MSLLKTLSHFLRNFFPEIWTIILISIIVITWTHASNNQFQNYFLDLTVIRSKLSSINFPRKINIISFILFILFLLGYTFLILYKADFAYFDYNIFTSYTLLEKNYPPPIWTGSGRFFPLGHQEWNLIRFLTQSPSGYHAFPILQLLIVIIALFFLFNQLPILIRLVTILFILTIPSFVSSFFTLHIPERNVIFWLVIFLLSFKYFLKTKSSLYFGICLIATHFALYYKEPVFLLFAGFSCTRLILNTWFERDLFLFNRKKYRIFLKAHEIDLGIIILSLIFILLFIFINLPYLNTGYASTYAEGAWIALLKYLSNPLLTLFLVIVATKFFYLLYFKKKPDLFWDSLAIGTVLYFLCYIKLELFKSYLTAPIDLIAVLYITQLIYPIIRNNGTKFLAFVLISFLFLYNIDKASSNIGRIKNVINSKVEIARFLKNYSVQNSHRNITLFFPFTDSPQLYYLSSFLEYKELQLYKLHDSKPTDTTFFTFKSPLNFPKNNQCVSWGRDHYCFHAQAPQSGDLILFLPGEISPAYINKMQQDETLLFEYQALLFNPQMNAYIFRKK